MTSSTADTSAGERVLLRHTLGAETHAPLEIECAGSLAAGEWKWKAASRGERDADAARREFDGDACARR